MMITRKNASQQIKTWEKQLAEAIKDPNLLLEKLKINNKQSDKMLQQHAHQQFKTLVPLSFVKRMQPGNLDDPLLQQVLPVAEECTDAPGYSLDPLAEQEHNPLPGLLHKFYGRVLIIAATGCVINCRYCFRRHFPYQQNQLGKQQWNQIFQYIANEASIKEVILSGGDPLLLKDNKLLEISNKLSQISHVKILRIHTRVPIALPERINSNLINALKQTSLNLTIVLHCNHAQEISCSVKQAVQKLTDLKATLLNQSVLLKGINDNVDALVDLSEALFDVGILPYYLNMLDKVKGAHHFHVDEKVAKTLLKGLKERLPGYLVPRLAIEVANHPHKQTIDVRG